MTKATKQLGGGAKDKYFRELFASAPGLAPLMARRLADLTRAEVSQVRIRQPLVDRAKHFCGEAASQPAAVESRAPEAKAADNRAKDEAARSPAPAAPPPATTADPFDPFAFTAVVVLKRQGAEALGKLLAGITDPAHLRQLAEKQHLGVSADAADAASLRAAILKAAQARIDDRRAAAS